MNTTITDRMTSRELGITPEQNEVHIRKIGPETPFNALVYNVNTKEYGLLRLVIYAEEIEDLKKDSAIGKAIERDFICIKTDVAEVILNYEHQENCDLQELDDLVELENIHSVFCANGMHVVPAYYVTEKYMGRKNSTCVDCLLGFIDDEQEDMATAGELTSEKRELFKEEKYRLEAMQEIEHSSRRGYNMDKIIKEYDVKCCPSCGGIKTLVQIDEYIHSLSIRCNKCKRVIECPNCGSKHVAFFTDIDHWICGVCAKQFDEIKRLDF